LTDLIVHSPKRTFLLTCFILQTSKEYLRLNNLKNTSFNAKVSVAISTSNLKKSLHNNFSYPVHRFPRRVFEKKAIEKTSVGLSKLKSITCCVETIKNQTKTPLNEVRGRDNRTFNILEE